MIDVDQIPAEPPADLRFRRKVRLDASLREIWRSRELIRTLAERDLRARYKQAVLGFAWAIIPPLGLLLVFSVFVRRVGDVHSDGVPYELLAFVGLMAWNFFSAAVSGGSGSLLGNLSLLNKIYCPREVFPLAQLTVATVDAAVSLIVFGALLAIHRSAPFLTWLWSPVLLAMLLAFTTGVVLFISSGVVYLRDLRHGLPIVLQLGLFATPVAYSMSAIPEQWRLLFGLANPLGPIIDGFRRVLLLGQPPVWTELGAAAITTVILLTGGYWTFKRLEVGVADVG